MNTMFKALGDKTRREILEMLRKKDLTAGEIADAFNISKPSISHHLDILRQAKLIASVKEGQFMVYSLNTSEVDEIIKWLYKFSKKNNK
jgi:DNA-binding transcriptional ArsR family regulator